MKIRIRVMSILTAMIIFILVNIDNSSANWYAGIERTPHANGVTAQISAPSIPLNMIEPIQGELSGESNWVSTYYVDSNGKDWLQAGWRYYYGYDTPKQYVEWCINCIGTQGIYDAPNVGNHPWGNTIAYWVDRDSGARWCAYSNGYQRHCEDNLHPVSVTVMAKSEIHSTSLNPLDTTFNNVRYKNPSNNNWYLFNSSRIWVTNYFPYDVWGYNNYHFRTYRHETFEAYIPLLIK